MILAKLDRGALCGCIDVGFELCFICTISSMLYPGFTIKVHIKSTLELTIDRLKRETKLVSYFLYRNTCVIEGF